MLKTDAASEDIRHRFAYHKPSCVQVQNAHEYIRSDMLGAAKTICKLVPEGRERATAITKLEEAMMWANAGIARNQEKAAELFTQSEIRNKSPDSK